MTKQIPLTQGHFALVDDADYEWLNQWKWCYKKPRGISSGYAERGKYHGTSRADHFIEHVRMHRFIMGCQYRDGKEVDHIDDNGLNNQKHNLRFATDLQNAQNRRTPPHNSSGYKGVHFHKANKKWVAYITVNKKRIHLGIFSSKLVAARTYDAAAIKYFGEFAHLNFPTLLPNG